MTDLASAEAELSNYTGALSLYKHALSIDPHHIGAMVGRLRTRIKEIRKQFYIDSLLQRGYRSTHY